MSGAEGYPYASGDLLENPHTYFFSSYQGEGFVSAWALSRSECKAALSAASDGRVAQAKDERPTSNSRTAAYFRELEDLFARPEFPDEDRKNLDAILRNFEAKKKIYQDYNPGFTSKDRTDYKALSLYVDFASLIVAAYARWQELPYLNALLKVLDILCASCGTLSASDKSRVSDIIDAEQRYVDELARRLQEQRP
jgi:hypothetical protein